jgi:hypothetical protein
MWVRLVLGFLGRRVLKTSECLRHVFEHGDMYSFVAGVSVYVHSQVALAIPTLQAFVMLVEDGGKVFGVFASDVLDAKVVDA